MLGPTLRGASISLEPLKFDDLETFRHWFADLEVTRNLLMRFVPSRDMEEKWYQNAATDVSTVQWSIAADGETIGNTGIQGIDWISRRGVTGTVIGDRSRWGHGYGTEAVRLRTAYAFEELGLESLESISVAENVSMHRVLAKSGYRKIGQRRHYLYKRGAWHDAYLFEVLREEWQARSI